MKKSVKFAILTLISTLLTSCTITLGGGSKPETTKTDPSDPTTITTSSTEETSEDTTSNGSEETSETSITEPTVTTPSVTDPTTSEPTPPISVTDPTTSEPTPPTSVTDPTTSEPTPPTTSTSDPTSIEPADPGYYKLNKEDIRFTNDSVDSGTNIPNISGTIDILVVPVEFSDLSPFTSTQLSHIENVFNAETGTNYWESLKSFYKKSSYGNLILNSHITDKFTPSISSSEFIDLEASTDGGGTHELFDEISVEGLTIDGTRVSNKNYDKNKDGFVDAVWLIYNEKDPNLGNQYWPYQYSRFETANKLNPVYENFANMALSFIYEQDSNGGDAHTIIHETGHLLGLDDYYSYDSGVSTGPLGGFDMMDYNIGDHNPFSKFSMGWLEPYVVTGDATIEISSFQSSGDTIIISPDFNNSAFCEYIMLEFYTPDGLNKLDSEALYSGRPMLWHDKGIKISYVDARLYEYLGSTTSGGYNFRYLESSNTSSDYYLYLANSNSHNRSFSRQYMGIEDEYLISLIAQDRNENLYNTTEDLYYTNKYHTDYLSGLNEMLFRQGDKFSKSKYSNMFKNGKFHDGSEINFEINIDSISLDKATISIDFLGF